MNSTSYSLNCSIVVISDILAKAHVVLLTLVVLIYLITGCIYIATWKLHSLAGRAFTQMLFCRAFHLPMLGVANLAFSLNWPNNLPSLCVLSGYLHQFFWLSEYSWLVLVNWDFWQRFKNLRPRRQKSNDDKNRKFFRYSLVGWGVPILISNVSLILTFTVPSKAGTYFVDFKSCNVTRGALISFLIPVISIFVLISCWFTWNTRMALKRHEDETEMARLAVSSTKHIEKETDSTNDVQKGSSRSPIFWKLSVLMGVNWQIEFIVAVLLFASFSKDRTPQPHGDLANWQHKRLLFLSGALVLIVFMLGSAIFCSFMFVIRNTVIRDEFKKKMQNNRRG